MSYLGLTRGSLCEARRIGIFVPTQIGHDKPNEVREKSAVLGQAAPLQLV